MILKFASFSFLAVLFSVKSFAYDLPKEPTIAEKSDWAPLNLKLKKVDEGKYEVNGEVRMLVVETRPNYGYVSTPYPFSGQISLAENKNGVLVFSGMGELKLAYAHIVDPDTICSYPITLSLSFNGSEEVRRGFHNSLLQLTISRPVKMPKYPGDRCPDLSSNEFNFILN